MTENRTKIRTISSQSGFTLIELIVVIVILSILLSAAIPKFFDLKDKVEATHANLLGNRIQAEFYGTFSDRLLEGDSCVKARQAGITAAKAVTDKDFTWDPVKGTATGPQELKFKSVQSNIVYSYTVEIPVCKADNP